MTWLMTLGDQLPLLLVLSPAIGFLLTASAARIGPEVVRHVAISNSLCTLLILCGAFWRFESESSSEAETQHRLVEEVIASRNEASTIEIVHGLLDRQRAERFNQRWLIIDGINLWPTSVLVILTAVIFWQMAVGAENLRWFFSNALLFQAACFTALLSYDLCLYLIASGTAAVAMTAMIGQWGGPDRRRLTERFLFAQFGGSAFVMLGFAMLVVAVPWMKIEDSPTLPIISGHIATIVYEIQKWTSGNELAFQYQNEIFPWMLLILSLGFAIQFGLFPFHSCQIAVLSDVPVGIAVLYVAGFLSSCSVGWLRFAMPVAPELMAQFGWAILIPSLGSAIWGALRALVSDEPRQRAAFIFLSLSGLSLICCCSFTRASFSSGWLMQQQLTINLCGALLVLSNCGSWTERKRDFVHQQSATAKLQVGGMKTRTMLLLLSLPSVGFFASSFVIVSELVPENLLLAACVFLVVALLLLTIYTALDQQIGDERSQVRNRTNVMSCQGSMIVVLALAIFVNLFPNQMLRQCEPEFARVFRRFERSLPADSAEPGANERQSPL